jgi:hypothetical protein
VELTTLLNTPNIILLPQGAKIRMQLMVAMRHTSNTINNTWLQPLQQQLSNLLHQAALLQVLLPRRLLAKRLRHLHRQVQLRELADTML